MLNILARNWWVVALRGALGVVVGVLAFVWPGEAFAALVLLFGAYLLVDGIFALVAAARPSAGGDTRWPLWVEGIAGVVAGVVTLVWPEAASLAVLLLIAAWAIATGILEVVAAVRLRREIEGEWLLALSGLASIVFGFILVMAPAAGILAIAWIFGAYALLFGLLNLFLGFRLRRWHQSTGGSASRAATGVSGV
jgi:uncharacterized membrane protein HdeD (DUF308 family)